MKTLDPNQRPCGLTWTRYSRPPEPQTPRFVLCSGSPSAVWRGLGGSLSGRDGRGVPRPALSRPRPAPEPPRTKGTGGTWPSRLRRRALSAPGKVSEEREVGGRAGSESVASQSSAYPCPGASGSQDRRCGKSGEPTEARGGGSQRDSCGRAELPFKCNRFTGSKIPGTLEAQPKEVAVPVVVRPVGRMSF